MVESFRPYLSVIRDALTCALCITNFPSQIFEKINRPQIEVEESSEVINKPFIICRSDQEVVEIERSINSVRINIVIKKYTDLENLLMGIYAQFLMNRADKYNILRKIPKEGYDISFLITNYHLEVYNKEDIIDFIVEFIQDLVKEVTDMKMTVNSQSRYVTTYLMEQLKI
jgi:actin related protein 2/3 complex subunit 4